jgi:hypothetical protein
MNQKGHSDMRFQDAMDMVPDDLPDGAYWAMAHEIAGLEYGEGFANLMPGRQRKAKARDPNSRRAARAALINRPKPEGLPHRCGTCGNDFATKGAKKRHRRDTHTPTGV